MNARDEPGAGIHVDASAGEGRETPFEGIRFRKLRHDRESGASAVLVRFEPGAKYAAHRHPGGEEYYVIEGSIRDGGRVWGAGSHVYHPPGTVHRSVSPGGCLLFISLPRPVELLSEKECREYRGRE